MDMCPSCGASNPLGVKWCNQCFARLGEPKPEASAVAVTPRPAAPATIITASIVSEGDTESVPIADAEAIWTCRTCQEDVPISVESCPACLTSIYENFGATENESTLDEKQLAMKALVPGGAHSTPDSPFAGVLLFMVVSMSLLFGLMMLPTAVKWAGVFVVVWGVGVWAFSIWDAAQSHASSRLLLQPRVSMVVGLLPLIVIIGAVLATVRA